MFLYTFNKSFLFCKNVLRNTIINDIIQLQKPIKKGGCQSSKQNNRHQSKKKGSYIIAQVQNYEKNKKHDLQPNNREPRAFSCGN